MSQESDPIEEALFSEEKSVSFDTVIETLKSAKASKSADDALEKIKGALASLDKDALDAILGNEDFSNIVAELAMKSQRSGKPGEPMFDGQGRQIGKIPYTYEYLCETFPMVEWTPMRTCPISYNGVLIHVWAGETVKTPACFRDIYMDSELQTAKALGQQAKILASAGGSDGSSVSVGWYKESDEELERKYGKQS